LPVIHLATGLIAAGLQAAAVDEAIFLSGPMLPEMVAARLGQAMNRIGF
jgi:hypothetical protein